MPPLWCVVSDVPFVPQQQARDVVNCGAGLSLCPVDPLRMTCDNAGRCGVLLLLHTVATGPRPPEPARVSLCLGTGYAALDMLR